jgi:hypothetical protein
MAEKSISAIRPVKPAPLDRFCRLFCPVEPAFDACAMTSLGCSMKNELSGGTNIPHGSRPTTIPAGFTYFGQFIDHDLTRDDTFLDNAGKLSPTETLNGGGGRLDLNHLYGDGPMSNAHGHLYAPDQASFLLGDSLSNGEPFDLLLKDNKPQAADDRSTENIFLRQLCAMFMKLHNLAVKELPADWSSMSRAFRTSSSIPGSYAATTIPGWKRFRTALARIGGKSMPSSFGPGLFSIWRICFESWICTPEISSLMAAIQFS